MPALPVHVPKDDDAFLRGLKLRIKDAQLRASLSVNRELIFLYWQIGRDILARQDEADWGAKVIDRLATDLHTAFPDVQGFSPRNLKYMRAFAHAWPDEAIVQAPLAQITWYHNLALLEKLKSRDHRLWYARQTIQFGWSRNILAHQIETDLHGRQGKALTNFDKTLPAAPCPHCPNHSERICRRFRSLKRNCGSLKPGRRPGNESSGVDRDGRLSRSHFFLETST